MNSDRVDIIVPVYNGELYLRKALESLREQSYENIRVLIVNDGSTDGSLAIIREFCERDARFSCYNRENKGLVSTLNFALKKSSAKYIARMDADDIAHKDRIKIQIEYLSENTDVNVCGTLAQYIDEMDTTLPKRKLNLPESPLECFARSFIRSPMIHPSVIIKMDRKVKNQVFYDEGDIFCEDFGLWLRILRSGGKVANVPNELLSYRVHDRSLSETKKKDMQDNACLLIRQHMIVYDIYLKDPAWNYFKKIRNHNYNDIRLSSHFIFFEIASSVFRSSKLSSLQKTILVKDIGKLLLRCFAIRFTRS